MRSVRAWVLWFVAGMLGLADVQTGYSQRIGPPFGLHWAEGQKEIEKIISRAGARIVEAPAGLYRTNGRAILSTP